MKPSLFLAAALVGAAAAAADRPADYAAAAAITTPSPDTLQRLNLPLPVLQQSRAEGFADVRVFNAKGESLPIAFIPARAEDAMRDARLPLYAWPADARPDGVAGAPVKVEVDVAGAIVRIDGRRVDGPAMARTATRWLIDASERGDNERLVELAFDWDRAGQDMARDATLEGSDDFTHWERVARATLVDLGADTQGSIVRDRITLEPGRRARKYLRLVVDGALPLRAVHARWRGDAPAPLDRAAVAFKRAAANAWHLDLEAPLALRRIQFSLPQPDMVLVATIRQRKDDQSRWHTVGQQTLYRLTRNGKELSGGPIDVTAPPAREWMLHADDPVTGRAADTIEAEIQWPQVALVFVAQGPAPWQLVVGRDGAHRHALPLEWLIPQYEAGDEARLPQATLAPVVLQPPVRRSIVERVASAQPEEKRRWALWLVLVGAVAGLAWLGRGLLRDVATSRT